MNIVDLQGLHDSEPMASAPLCILIDYRLRRGCLFLENTTHLPIGSTMAVATKTLLYAVGEGPREAAVAVAACALFKVVTVAVQNSKGAPLISHFQEKNVSQIRRGILVFPVSLNFKKQKGPPFSKSKSFAGGL